MILVLAPGWGSGRPPRPVFVFRSAWTVDNPATVKNSKTPHDIKYIMR
jgi:hypothetical protein